MADTKLQVVINAKDNASAVLSGVGSKIQAVGKVSAVAIAGIGVASSKMAMDFEKSMSNVSTLLDTGTEDMGKMKKEILDLSKRTPVALSDLTSSLYDVRSAGIGASEAMSVLEESSRLGVAGLGTTKEATTLMTLALNNFKDSGLSANEVSDVLFKTVRGGITTIGDLSQSFGLVAPLAVEAGVSFEELQAMTAALTQVNKSASISQNQIKASLISLGKPTKEAVGLFDKLGVETFGELIDKSGGYMNAMKKLKEATEGNSQTWNKAIGSGEALSAVNALLGVQSEAVAENMKSMTEGANLVNEAFEKQKETASAQYDILKNKLGAALIDIGSVILPRLLEALKFVEENWWRVGDAMEKGRAMLDEIKKAIEPHIEKWKQLEEPLKKFAEFIGIIIVASIIIFIGIMSAMLNAVVNAEDGIIKMVGGLLSIFNNFIEFFVNIFTGQWGEAWENVKGIGQGALDFFTGMFDTVLNLIKGFGEGIVGFFNWLFDILVGSSIIPDMVNAIVDWFVKLKDMAFDKVKEFSDGLVNKFTEIKDAIVGVMEDMANSVASAVQRMIDAMKSAPSNVGGFIGGKIQSGLSALGIPHLASGGIITRPTLAMVGEAGPEAVVPLNRASGVGGIIVNINGGTYLSESVAEEMGDMIIDKLKNQLRI